MGSFWGLDNAGKEAQGWPRESGAYSSQQFKDWLDRQNSAYNKGDATMQWWNDYTMNRANNGIGPVSAIKDTASQIMPGINDYVSNLKNTAQGQIDSYKSNVPSAADTMQKINALNDENLGYIDQTRNFNLKDIGDTYGRAQGSENTANDTVNKDLTDRYGNLMTQANTDYGTALDNAELMRPGGEAQTAQVARSNAGAVSSAATSLRRMGIDPNSPQAAAIMAGTRANQARAMDDAAAASTDKYVGTKNDLILGRNKATTGLSLDQGAGVRGEAVRHSGALNTLDANRSAQTQDLQEKTLGQITQNEKDKQDAAVMGKTLGTQDWQTVSGLQDKINDADLQGFNLNDKAWERGMNYTTTDVGSRDQAANAIGNYGKDQLNYAVQSGNMARGFNGDALSAYGTAYGYEAPQAGYGAKTLAAIAQQGVEAIPGVGPVAGAFTAPATGAYASGSGAYGGYGQPGGGGYGGGYGGGGYGGGGGYSGYGQPGGGQSSPYSSSAYGGQSVTQAIKAMQAWNSRRSGNKNAAYGGRSDANE